MGRYGVALDDLERLAIAALQADADVVVVDELGKMELASAPFRDAVIALLDRSVAVLRPCTPAATRSPTSSSAGHRSRSFGSRRPTATRCPPLHRELSQGGRDLLKDLDVLLRDARKNPRGTQRTLVKDLRGALRRTTKHAT